MIDVRGLRKTYRGGVDAVRDIDFDVAPGEVFGLFGPDGAGKSTTVSMLTTTIAPTAGSGQRGRLRRGRQALDARRVSGVVFQEPVVDRALTGRAHLELHRRP
jgi:ABC-2 type transport system ATP-binding protein